MHIGSRWRAASIPPRSITPQPKASQTWETSFLASASLPPMTIPGASAARHHRSLHCVPLHTGMALRPCTSPMRLSPHCRRCPPATSCSSKSSAEQHLCRPKPMRVISMRSGLQRRGASSLSKPLAMATTIWTLSPMGADVACVGSCGFPRFRWIAGRRVELRWSAATHNRADFLNFGSRINCCGWGESPTCGYGDLTGRSDGRFIHGYSMA